MAPVGKGEEQFHILLTQVLSVTVLCNRSYGRVTRFCSTLMTVPSTNLGCHSLFVTLVLEGHVPNRK